MGRLSDPTQRYIGVDDIDVPTLIQQDSEKRRRLTVFLKPDLAKALAVAASQNAQDLNEMVNDAIQRWLEHQTM